MGFTFTKPCACCSGYTPCNCPECGSVNVENFTVTFGNTTGTCVACLALANTTITLTRMEGLCIWILDYLNIAFLLQYDAVNSRWSFSFGSAVACDEEFSDGYISMDFTCADGGNFTFQAHGSSTVCGIFDSVLIVPADAVPCTPPGGAAPGFMAKAMSFGKAVTRHALNMARNVPEDEYSRRMEICNGCDRKQGDQCLQCGCRLSVKARWESEACPLGKWQ